MENKQLPGLFIDTCILHSNFDFSSQSWTVIDKIIKYKQYTNCKVFIPEMVISELSCQYKESILWVGWYEDTIKAINKRIDKINKYCYNQAPIAKTSPSTDITDLIDWYESFLKRRILDHDFEIVPNPNDIVLNKLMTKCIGRKKPFDKKSDKWFKDAIIRESYLNLLSKNSWEVIFLSKNSSDFWNDSKNDFHEDLKSELWDLVGIYQISIDEVRKTYLDNIISFISYETVSTSLPRKELIDSLNNNLGSKVPVDDDFQMYSYNDVWVESVWNIQIKNIKSLYIVSKSEELTKLKVTIEISVDYNISLSWTRPNAKMFESILTNEGTISINVELNNFSWQIRRLDEVASLWNKSENSKSLEYEDIVRYKDKQDNKFIVLEEYLWLQLNDIKISDLSDKDKMDLEEDKIRYKYLKWIKE